MDPQTCPAKPEGQEPTTNWELLVDGYIPCRMRWTKRRARKKKNDDSDDDFGDDFI